MAAFPMAFCDANVLYSVLLRDLLIRLSLAGLCELRWSEQVQDEWTRNLLTVRPDQTQALTRIRTLMDRALPQAVGGALGVELLGGVGRTALAETGLLSRLLTVAGQGMGMIGAVVFMGGLLRFIQLYLPELKLPISFGSSVAKENWRRDG